MILLSEETINRRGLFDASAIALHPLCAMYRTERG